MSHNKSEINKLLYKAILNDDIEAIRSYNADYDSILFEYEATPLLLAVINKKYLITKELLIKGCNPNLLTRDGKRNPLLSAVLYEDTKMIDMLVNGIAGYETKKADINMVINSKTILNYATEKVMKPNGQFIKFLLEIGAKPNDKDKENFDIGRPKFFQNKEILRKDHVWQLISL